MFSFFKKSRLALGSVILPETGLTFSRETPTEKRWVNAHESLSFSLFFFQLPPDLPLKVKDVDSWRAFYRNIATEKGGGLVECNLVDMRGLTGIRFIIKIPQQPHGMYYMSAITIPFLNYSYVIRVQALEIGPTGFREAVVVDQLLKSKEIQITDNGIDNWMADPYDKSIKTGMLLNLAEDRKYDNQFPDHPLSALRQLLDKLQGETQFAPEVYKAAPYWIT